MQLTYRGRIIAYNIAIFLAIFGFILFCIVQGTIYHYVITARSELAVMGQNATLYIEESAESNSDGSDAAAYFNKMARQISSAIFATTNTPAFIFSSEGKPLYNPTDDSSLDFSESISQAEATGNATILYTESMGTPVVEFLQPITFDGERIGYIGFLYSLAAMDAQLNTCLFFYALGCALGFPLLIVITLSYSNHFIQPIKELTKISKEITHGNYNVQIHYRREDEIGDLTRVFNSMTQNVNNVINQLNSERNRLASVLASLDDGLLALDAKGNVITSNSYIKTYFDVSNPKTIYDFQCQSFLRDIFDDLKNGKLHISVEVDSNDRNLLIIGSPIRKAEFEENYMIVIRNMTSTKQIQKEQQQFISSVSHELRTPLTTIIGYTDMLRRRQVMEGEILNRSLDTMNREGHRLLRLVDDLLNVNQLERPEFDVKKTNLNLHTLLDEVVEQMEIKSQQKEISINYKSDENLPEILGDYGRLQQLFINILHNAIKYSDKGDIIDVVSTLEEDNIIVSIRDYGVGISENDQKKIFSAFYRVEEDRARNEGEGGAGLGLYLAKQIVDKHHGTISMESVLGEGTNISISLPILIKTVQEGLANE